MLSKIVLNVTQQKILIKYLKISIKSNQQNVNSTEGIEDIEHIEDTERIEDTQNTQIHTE